MTIAEAARAAYAAGLSVLPPTEDGTKRPWTGEWTQYQDIRAFPDQIAQWWGPRTGLGAVLGKVSGNLEVMDFDDRAVYERFVEAASRVGLGPVIERIETGYVEDTPKNGVHWLYHCSEIGRNTKLALRPVPNSDPLTLIETK